MRGYRKLGRKTNARISMLRGLVTDLLLKGRIKTTATRAKEVQKIAERMIVIAVREKDNFTSREILSSEAKLNSKGQKLLKSKESRNGKHFDAVERELKTKTVQVDNPSRLAARKLMMKWLIAQKDEEGKILSPTNYVFNELAPKYAGVSGGYTRRINIGPRKGDAADMVLLELV